MKLSYVLKTFVVAVMLAIAMSPVRAHQPSPVPVVAGIDALYGRCVNLASELQNELTSAYAIWNETYKITLPRIRKLQEYQDELVKIGAEKRAQTGEGAGEEWKTACRKLTESLRSKDQKTVYFFGTYSEAYLRDH